MEIQVTRVKTLKRIPFRYTFWQRVWQRIQKWLFYTPLPPIKYRLQLQLWVTPSDYIVAGDSLVSQDGKVWFCVARYPLSFVVDLVEPTAETTFVVDRVVVVAHLHPESSTT